MQCWRQVDKLARWSEFTVEHPASAIALLLRWGAKQRMNNSSYSGSSGFKANGDGYVRVCVLCDLPVLHNPSRNSNTATESTKHYKWRGHMRFTKSLSSTGQTFSFSCEHKPLQTVELAQGQRRAP